MDTECASENTLLQKELDCEIWQQLEEGMSVNKDTRSKGGELWDITSVEEENETFFIRA